jgi:predicted lactoylglutathione lyase
MDQRVSFITLGVADLARARAFYERLGWKASPASQDSIVFFDLNGVVLGLFGRKDLADDAGVADGAAGFSAVTLACNQRSEAEVDAVMKEAEAAGAKIVTPAEKVFWGGYRGYFTDPDGHIWEVAHNPFAPIDAEGRVKSTG